LPYEYKEDQQYRRYPRNRHNEEDSSRQVLSNQFQLDNYFTLLISFVRLIRIILLHSIALVFRYCDVLEPRNRSSQLRDGQ